MSCDGLCPQRRGFIGWLLLIPFFGFVVFYGLVLARAANPAMDEAYRRTFLTREFAVFPTSDVFKPGNGLDYTLGTYVSFSNPDTRNWLGRFDWHRVDRPAVTLVGFTGRLYFHAVGEPEVSRRRHVLKMAINCRFAARHSTEIEISVNNRTVAIAYCSDGPVRIETDVPAGVIGAAFYDEIAVHRVDGSLFEHLATRLGLRAQAIELVSFEVDGV